MDNFNSDEINLLDYWRIIVKNKKMITSVVVVSLTIAVFVSLFLPKSYKAESVIMPISSKGGAGGALAALSSQFGSLVSLAGGGLSGADDVSKFVTILKSRTLSENVINLNNLMPILFSKLWDSKNGKWKSKEPTIEDAVNFFRSVVNISEDKKNKTIKITAEFGDPQTAATLANVTADELQRFINDNAFTVAKRNRIFIEKQVEQNKRALLEAGKEINEFYTANRISNSEAKVDVSLNVGDLIQAVDNNSDVDVLFAKKTELDKKIDEAKVVKNVPQQVYLTYLMLRKELLAKMDAILATQYEMAKIEESKDELAFQVIDKAVPPLKKFKPKRAQICIMAFVASLFCSIFLAFFREYLDKVRSVRV